MVAPANVRQSHVYNVSVSLAGANSFDASFVYEAIPRNGRGRIFSPWDAPDSDTLPKNVDDGITLEIEAGIDMAWSQFEYAQDVDVKVVRRDGTPCGPPSNVVLRPTAQRYEIFGSDDGGIVVRVPFDPEGRRFSVEFMDGLYEFRSDGSEYVRSGGSVVGVEPRHSLLVFASPPLPPEALPDMTPESTHTMSPGPIRPASDLGSSEVLYFPPGVYWVNQAASGAEPKLGENHLVLHPDTTWVHFAPGAYVKGAIEWTNTAGGHLRATGHGVLSGEHYVYQANPTSYYQAIKSDQESLRMWWHKNIQNGQTWHCVGPTIAAPPFNTMDLFGPGSNIAAHISDYKQVGSFFFQTDGPQMYPGSIVRDVFYHVNDDAIKAYHSNVSLSNAVVWKAHNDPVVQIGWFPRDVHGVAIDRLSVVHSRYRGPNTYVPTAIIGGSPCYQGGWSACADTTKQFSMEISRVVVEGPWGGAPGLFRIWPLVNYDIKVRSVEFHDGLLAGNLGESEVPFADGVRVNMNLAISNWTVGGKRVTMRNFQSNSLGRFNIDLSYWGQWQIT